MKSIKVSASKGKSKPTQIQNLAKIIAILTGIGACTVVGVLDAGQTAWGLLPILLYAVFCIWGIDIVLATAIALIAAFAIMQAPPVQIGLQLGKALSNNVTVIGLVSVIGAGLGEVLRNTGVANKVVQTVLKGVGIKSEFSAITGIFLASALVVFMLGTIGGSLAIAGPILIAFATQYKITRRATAVAFMFGGCAGLALAPYAGSNIAIIQAADVTYGQYIFYGAGPLAIVSIVVGLPLILIMQKQAALQQDYYPPLSNQDSTADGISAGFATLVFVVGLIMTIAYATYSRAGITLPLVVLPVLAFVTGIAAGKSPSEITHSFYRGAGSVIHLFLLFWMLSALFNVIDNMGPFERLVAEYKDSLLQFSPYGFLIIVAFIGLFGIPGASAAVVVLVDQMFGGIASQIGVSSAAWIIVLIFSSKGDTYGPFPNPNMVTCMGMARYDNLKYMLLAGWIFLVPCTLMYAVLLMFV